MAPEKKAELLASRVAIAEFEEAFEAALLAFHLFERKELMAAFLDSWEIPHEDGAIEVDDYPIPSVDEVRGAVKALGERFGADEINLYLATAGLVMGEGGSEWRDAAWPVVDESVTQRRDG